MGLEEGGNGVGRRYPGETEGWEMRFYGSEGECNKEGWEGERGEGKNDEEKMEGSDSSSD